MLDQATALGWDATSLLQPEVLLPEQMLGDGPRERTGELALLWAVFIDGIRTYCSEIVCRRTNGLAYREAERWIFRPDSEATTSFSTLCLLFDVDARQLRRRLLAFRDSPTSEVSRVLEQAA